MTVICGVLGTIVGLGIYEQFLFWIDLLATIAPPLIGPLLAEFYLFRKRNFTEADTATVPVWNPLAFIAYGIGVASTFYAPEWIAKALVGLIASVVAYWLLALVMPRKTANA